MTTAQAEPNEPNVLRLVTLAATVALAKARLLDGRMPSPDPAVIAAWAEAFYRTRVTREEAAAAVIQHYRQPAPRPLMPGDVLDLVHSKRRTQAAHDDWPATRSQLAARRANPPQRLGRYAGIDLAEAAAEAAGHTLPAVPRWPATTCPHCDARPGQHCTTAGNPIPRDRPHPSRPDHGGQP